MREDALAGMVLIDQCVVYRQSYLWLANQGTKLIAPFGPAS
jgi:hypothetical protein